MDTEIVNSKDYTIITEEGNIKGLFFRFPIKKVSYSTYDLDNRNAFSWIENAPKKIIPYILNWRNYKEWKRFLNNESNAAGMNVNELASPIYFKCKIRRLKFRRLNNKIKILKIESWGYEPYKNCCSGSCEVEHTKIYYTDGSVEKIKNKGKFKWTYSHKIKEIINPFLKER